MFIDLFDTNSTLYPLASVQSTVQIVLEILIGWFEEHDFVPQLVSSSPIVYSVALNPITNLLRSFRLLYDNSVWRHHFVVWLCVFCNRVAGCMPCWPAWRSPCCQEPTRPLDSWPGDALSSEARWYCSHCPLLPPAVVSNHCRSALTARFLIFFIFKSPYQLPGKMPDMRFQICSGCLSSCLELFSVILSTGERGWLQTAWHELAHLSCCEVWLLAYDYLIGIDLVLHFNAVFSHFCLFSSWQIFWAEWPGRSAWTNLSDLFVNVTQ